MIYVEIVVVNLISHFRNMRNAEGMCILTGTVLYKHDNQALHIQPFHESSWCVHPIQQRFCYNYGSYVY